MGMEVGFPDLDQIHIPRRRRGSSGAGTETSKPPISMLEAAVVLMVIAYSVPDVESFCNCELERYKNTHKRKNPPTTTTTTKKPARKKRANQSEFPSIPEMPVAMRERIVEMGGHEINLVIQKQLQDTDLNKNHGRLSLPAKKLLFDFATEEERKLLSEQENKNKKGMNVVIMADVWFFDSGATYHMTSRREWFHHYEPVSGGSVFSCNDHALKIIGIGTIKLKLHDNTVRTIQQVRHVEGLKKNLLSLGQLDDLNCKVVVEKGIMKVIRGALVLMKGKKVNANLYMLEGETLQEGEASVTSSSPSEKLSMIWHKKLGHMSK